MTVSLPDIPPEQRTSLVETLLDMVRPLLDRVRELEASNQQLCDEIDLLKGQKPRPQISPSILQLPSPTATSPPKERRRGKPTRPRTTELTIPREVPLHLSTLPEGATLKGYEPYVVQDLLIQLRNNLTHPKLQPLHANELTQDQLLQEASAANAAWAVVEAKKMGRLLYTVFGVRVPPEMQ